MAGCKAFQQLWTAQGMAPNLHFTVAWAAKAKLLKWKDDAFQKKLIRPKATHNHHPIPRVAVAAAQTGHRFKTASTISNARSLITAGSSCYREGGNLSLHMDFLQIICNIADR